MADFIDLWVNCPDRATADRIADACIQERLAACANIMAPIASTYHWQGNIERAQEVPLVLKTRAGLFDALCAKIRSLHPYEVPSIVATAIALADREYADWLRQETRESA
ncbi:divalent-cation tolerance protein CutA [Mesorhizobium sp. J18]|uniref:divalent-cation tolerance protein CutA n=1 Tax=Mesorhizobium sp. J18 TaxID=935263 RepID=UPI001FEE7C56|nr:divalent-cation tolerance protein CutA [Mesorhizobium sp. J18]